MRRGGTIDPVEHGRRTAEGKRLKDVRRAAVKAGLAAGRQQTDIAAELGVTKMAVSLIARRIAQEGGGA